MVKFKLGIPVIATVQKVGNKSREEGIAFASKADDMSFASEFVSTLVKNTFKFDTFSQFDSIDSLDMNPSYRFVRKIFENKDEFVKQSNNLARHLYDQSIHSHISNGEFYVIYIDGCIINDETVDAVMLLKTEAEMSETKIILDACCGSRMFWFDKKNPLALFADIRDEEYILCDGRNLKVHPDIVSDFTDMPFLDKSFKLVVFDPPHLLKVGKNSWLAKKYGKLPEDWPRVIKKGIDECFRVLDDYGVLIFKWNEDQITVREVLSAINRQPLFGHTTGRHGKTMWMCFMKLPIN